MSTELNAAQPMPAMSIIGGEEPFHPFVGPDRWLTRSVLREHKRDWELDLPYYVRTTCNQIRLCYFDEENLIFMEVEHPPHRYGMRVQDKVAAYRFVANTDSYLEHIGRLPNERLTANEEPTIPELEPRIEAEVRYNDSPYVNVIGLFRFSNRPDRKIMVFPCAYLGNGQWHNFYLKTSNLVPDGWCYISDLLVPVAAMPVGSST